MLLFEWEFFPGGEFCFGGSFYVLVKAGDGDFSFGILQLADDFNQREERVGSGSAVHTGVKIGFGASAFDFRIDQTAQADAERREIGREEFGIADQGEIRFELFAFFANVGSDGFASYFFFAFHDDFEIERELAAVSLHEGFEGLHLHPELALVVDGTARIDIVIALGRFEGRRDPFVERIGRLDVVVGVAENGGLAGSVEPVGIKKRVAAGGNDLDVFQSNALHVGGNEFGGALNVGFVFCESADAGDAKKIFEFVDEAGLILTGISYGIGRHKNLVRRRMLCDRCWKQIILDQGGGGGL